MNLYGTLYRMISFDYELMDKHIENLVNQDITSLRMHQQMIEAVLGNALNNALMKESDEIVTVTEDMFKEAERSVLGTDKRRVGFAS